MIAKHHILMIMLLLGFVSLEADEVINSRTVDSLSYKFYQEQKWDSLLWIGKIALDHHVRIIQPCYPGRIRILSSDTNHCS